MKPRDDLFRLIKSLSKSEKGYFKKFSSVHVLNGRNDYVRLFDAIDAQESYDENHLREVLGNSGAGRHLAAAKYHLFNQILKSQRAYHSGKSVQQRLHRLIEESRLLLDKGLIHPARERIRKARQLAEEHQKDTYTLLALRLERELEGAQYLNTLSHDELHKRFEREREVLATIENTNRYEQLNKSLFKLLSKQGTTRDAGYLEPFRAHMEGPLLKDDANARSFQTRLYYYQIHATYYHAYGDQRLSHRYTADLLMHIEANPLYLHNNPITYINVLCNFIGTALPTGFIKEAQAALTTMAGVSVRSEFEEQEKFLSLASQEIFVALYQKDVDNLSQVIERVENCLQRYEERVPQYLAIYFHFHLARAYCCIGEFAKALTWIERVLHSPNPDQRSDLYCSGRIMHLIIHFELDNQSMLEYAVKSAYRYLAQRNRLYRFESIVLRFLRRLTQIVTRAQLIALFQSVRTELLALTGDHYERKAFDYFEWIQWLDSRIQGKPFAEILRCAALQYKEA